MSDHRGCGVKRDDQTVRVSVPCDCGSEAVREMSLDAAERLVSMLQASIACYPPVDNIPVLGDG